MVYVLRCCTLCDVYVLKTWSFGTLTLCAATFCNITSCEVYVTMLYVMQQHPVSSTGIIWNLNLDTSSTVLEKCIPSPHYYIRDVFVVISEVDPEWFFQNSYPDPTFQLASDPYPDPTWIFSHIPFKILPLYFRLVSELGCIFWNNLLREFKKRNLCF
jgi:hypothetical protein